MEKPDGLLVKTIQVPDMSVSRGHGSDLKTPRRTNTGEKPYRCQLCQKSFADGRYLKRHMRTHTGEKPYKCQLCEKSFGVGCNLKEHMRTHTGEKPYRCQQCDKSFAQGGALKRHMDIHTGEKPYRCQLCPKSFTQGYTLKSHLRTHTGEKPYRCRLCEKSFRVRSAHMRTHTGEKPYICEVCKKGFSEVGGLKRHRRIRACDKQHKGNNTFTIGGSSEKQFELSAEKQPQDIKMESEVIANLTDNSITGSNAAVIDKADMRSSRNIQSDSRGQVFLLKSFGCGICGDLFEIEKEFLDHCSSHRLSAPDDLAWDLAEYYD